MGVQVEMELSAGERLPAPPNCTLLPELRAGLHACILEAPCFDRESFYGPGGAPDGGELMGDGTDL